MPVDIDPIAAMRNPGAFSQTLHMVIAAYAATAIAVAGIHAFLLRRHPHSRFHQHALAVALSVAIPFAILQPISGDPERAIRRAPPTGQAGGGREGESATMRGAPLRIGGIPDEAAAYDTVRDRDPTWAVAACVS